MVLTHDRILKPLSDILTIKVGFTATDPRDHIYGLLNLMPRSEWPSNPDYSKDVIEVFAAAAIRLMGSTQSLEFLRLCRAELVIVYLPPALASCIPQMFKTELRGQIFVTLPSWVPNWSRTIPRPSQNQFGTCHGSSGSIYSCDAGIPPLAQVRGPEWYPSLFTHTILYDSIHVCAAFNLSDETIDLQALTGTLQHTFTDGDWSSAYLDRRESRREALLRTLLVDCNKPGCRATSTDVADFASRMSSKSKLTIREQNDLLKRVLFITKLGLFGVAPYLCNVDDFIAIVPGCSVPLVLRGYQNDNLHQLIGDSCSSTLFLISTNTDSLGLTVTQTFMALWMAKSRKVSIADNVASSIFTSSDDSTTRNGE